MKLAPVRMTWNNRNRDWKKANPFFKRRFRFKIPSGEWVVEVDHCKTGEICKLKKRILFWTNSSTNISNRFFHREMRTKTQWRFKLNSPQRMCEQYQSQ